MLKKEFFKSLHFCINVNSFQIASDDHTTLISFILTLYIYIHTPNGNSILEHFQVNEFHPWVAMNILNDNQIGLLQCVYLLK